MRSYLITNEELYTNDIDKFSNILQYILDSKKIDFICFRDKVSSNYKLLAQQFVNIAKQYNKTNIFINSYIDLAYQLKATGVHLTSTQFNQINYAKSLGLKVIISCHNEDDILQAIDYKVDYITYSPIFNSPNKGKAKGIDNLKYIAKRFNKDIKIFALGGIVSNQQIDLIKDIDIFGFASIRYFID